MRTFRTTLVLLGVAVATVTLTLLDASAPTSCGRADDGRAAGLFVQSAKEYAGILADEPSSHCADVGMKVLCTQANDLARRHLTREANAVYKAMFNHVPRRTGGAQKTYRRCAELGEDKTALDPKLTTTSGAGPAGPRGPAGKNGLDGRNGVNGKNGANGVNGRNGADGKNARASKIIICNGAGRCKVGR